MYLRSSSHYCHAGLCSRNHPPSDNATVFTWSVPFLSFLLKSFPYTEPERSPKNLNLIFTSIWGKIQTRSSPQSPTTLPSCCAPKGCPLRHLAADSPLPWPPCCQYTTLPRAPVCGRGCPGHSTSLSLPVFSWSTYSCLLQKSRGRSALVLF